MGHRHFLCCGLAGAVPPTERTETPVTKQAESQENICWGWGLWRHLRSWFDFITEWHDGKFHPGQTADLDEEDFKVRKMFRMNNLGSILNLEIEYGTLEVQYAQKLHPLNRLECVRRSRLAINPENIVGWFLRVKSAFLNCCNLYYHL